MIIKIIILLVVIWVSIYSISFGLWTWKNQNRLGGMMVMCFALIALLLPGYILFFS